MKKILLLIVPILFIKVVSAEPISKVEYKWYKEEEINITYHPKKEKLSGYYENENKIEYGNYSKWDNKYCSYDPNYYEVSKQTVNKYQKVIKTRYIKLELINTSNNLEKFKIIKVFYEDEELNYTIVQNDEYGIKLELEKEYDTDKLHFYIETNYRYCIYLANNFDLTKIALGYFVMYNFDGYLLYPNANWILESSVYVEELDEHEITSSPFIKYLDKEESCRVREINTYRYQIQKQYYDDNYHVYIKDYIPDIESSIIYYEEPNRVEVINNIKEIPKVKTITKEIKVETICPYNEKYLDKIVIKKPKILYIISIFLVIIILYQRIKLIKNNVD